MTNNLEKKVVESPDNLDSLSNDYCVKSSNISYFGKLKQGFNSLKKNIRKKALPLVLGTALLCGGVSCDLSNPSNPYNPPETPDKKDKVVILMNTSKSDEDLTYMNYTGSKVIKSFYDILQLDKPWLSYNSDDIYVLGHDPVNLQFENYRQLTRENLTNLMQEIDEKYSDDAFLMINSIGNANLVDFDEDGVDDGFKTSFSDENFSSKDYHTLVSSFLEDDRKVLLALNKPYSEYAISSFEENPLNNVLVLTSAKKNENPSDPIFLSSFSILLRDAESKDKTLFNGDGFLDGEEAGEFLYNRMTGVYDTVSNSAFDNFGKPCIWSCNNTCDFKIIKY